MPSDDFFAKKSHIFDNQKIDVALVDGLHEYASDEQYLVISYCYIGFFGVFCNKNQPAASIITVTITTYILSGSVV